MTIRIYDNEYDLGNVTKVMFGNDITKENWKDIVLKKFIGFRDIFFVEERNGWELYDVEGDLPRQLWIKKNVIEYSITGIPCCSAVLTEN